MAPIDHSAILRVSSDDGLESITLRSDLAARYTFLNETLLEALGAVAITPAYREPLALTDVCVSDPAVSEHEYLQQWEARLRAEVDQLEQLQQLEQQPQQPQQQQ
jgi:hypothetical protein